MVKISFILRELLQNKQQPLLFILCLILSVSSFIALEGFNENVTNFVNQDSKALVGGDLIVESRRKYSEPLQNKINNLSNNYTTINSYEFTTIVYSNKSELSLLSQMRVIDSAYPLYGEVVLKSRDKFNETFDEGKIFVEENLLDRLEVEVGESIQIGNTSLIIADVIEKEPDRPLTFFAIGPRIIANSKDLEKMNLVGDRSRVTYNTFFKVDNENEIGDVKEQLKIVKGERERVESFDETESSIKRFTDNFLFFLKMVVFFTIVLSSIGMTSTLGAYLSQKKDTIAIMKTLGNTNRQILIHYISSILVLTLVALIFGIIFGILLQLYIPSLFSGILPKEIVISISVLSIVKGFLLAFFISVLFSLLPLRSLGKIKPIAILRKDDNSNEKKSKEYYFITSLIIVLFTIFIFQEFNNIFVSLSFISGFLVIFAILYILTSLVLKSLKKINFKNKFIILKYAIKGLYRPGANTILIIAAIATSLTVIFTISLVELNLQEQFVDSFPQDSPNVFLIDIKKDQVENISKLLDQDLNFYPIIRGGVINARGKTINQIESEVGEGEPVTRDFSLTYSNTKLDTEEVTESINEEEIFSNNWNKGPSIVQVSAMDIIADRMKLEIGDPITFSVQGVEIDAEVVSLRKRKEESIQPYFYFVFEPKVLEDAPQTILTATNLEPEKISEFQNSLAKNYPNITTFNLSEIAKAINDIIKRLSSIIQFFTIFSMIAGTLILISSIFATSIQRTKEAVFYKLVGTNSKFILKIFAVEYLLIGILSSFLAIFFSTLATFLISKYFLEINFSFLVIESILLSIANIILILIIGLLSSLNLIKKKPIEYIRENRIE